MATQLKYPPVTNCELRKYKSGRKYFAEFAEPWQPPKTTQKHKPAKKPGLWLTRVTTILQELNKHSLYGWYAQCTAEWWRDRINEGWGRQKLIEHFWDSVNSAKARRDEAAYIGSQTHRAIEEYLVTGWWPDCSELLPETRHALACWQEWFEFAQLATVDVEATVYSLIHGYGGTVDLIATDSQGRRVIVDWKTSSEVHSEHLWQLAAYAQALSEMGQPVPDVGIIVRIPKKFADEKAEWVIAWETPEQRQALIAGFSAFVLGLSLRPKSVKLQTYDAAREIPNAEGLFDQDDDQVEAELDALFAIKGAA